MRCLTLFSILSIVLAILSCLRMKVEVIRSVQNYPTAVSQTPSVNSTSINPISQFTSVNSPVSREYAALQNTQHKSEEEHQSHDSTGSNEVHNFSTIVHVKPNVTWDDAIMSNRAYMNAVVLEEFKLVFFPVPKAGTTEWKVLFGRAMGVHVEDDMRIRFKNRGLKRLYRYPFEHIQHIMTSKEWTRAIFVREPKERILSAFLNKFVDHSYFQGLCCNKKRMHKLQRNECAQKRSEADFSYFLKHIKYCHKDPHWKPQSSLIDDKWWPYITFVGYMHSIGSDAKQLLESVKSSKDNLTLWEKFGRAGWGINGTESFMSTSSSSAHPTNAREKLTKFYSGCDELFVENYMAKDWESPFFHFDKFQMYARNQGNSTVLDNGGTCEL